MILGLVLLARTLGELECVPLFPEDVGGGVSLPTCKSKVGTRGFEPVNDFDNNGPQINLLG